MRIGNRNFPYPILNTNLDLTSYMESSKFGFDFQTTPEGNVIVEDGVLQFKKLHFILVNQELNDLYESGKVAATFVVECSASTYRRSFPLTLEPVDLAIEARDLNGIVVVSAYLYANCDLKQYSNKEFNEIYQGYKFDLDKFDILAVDDGGKFKVNIDPSEDDKVSSIFTVVKVETNNKFVSVDIRQNQIVIQLPRIYYEQYDKIKRRNEYNNIAFAMLAIPALSSCLAELQQYEFNSTEELIEQYSWMESVQRAYKQVTGMDFDLYTFNSEQPFKIAQILLNHSSCKGIEDFGKMISGNSEEGGEEDE